MHAQTLVNKINEEHTAAATITVDFISSTRDSIGDVYVAGNTYNVFEQSEDAIIRKYQSGTGTIQWEYIYTDVSGLADFATDVYVKNNIVYVTGTSMDPSTGESLAYSLLLDASDGTELDLQKYSSAFGSYVVGASIKADSYGNYYVAGTEQSDSNDFQIFVLGYDANGGLLWETYYDSLGRYDGAVNMKLTKGNLDVIGYSGTAFSSWDFVTLKINPANGTIINRTFSANGNGNISKPVDFTTDFLGDLYVLGETALSPTNTDWKLIKYDTLFNEIWVKTFGSADSLADKPAGIAADNAGHLIVTGFTSKPDGSTDATTVRYHRNGSILWQRSIAASVAGEDAKATDLVSAAIPDTDFFICGTSHHQGDDDFFTASYDINGNLQWLKYFNDTTASQDRARDLQIDGSGLIYTSGSFTTPTDTGFVTVVYEEWERNDSYALDTDSVPLYVKKQLIVRFDTSVVKKENIDKDGLVFGELNTFLRSDMVDTLQSTLPDVFLRDCKLIKLAENYKTYDTTLVTNIGDTIKMPPLWTFFQVVYSKSDSSDSYNASIIDSLYPLVRFTQLNYIGRSFSCGCSQACPDDDFYETEQYSLHDDPNSSSQDGDIGAEGAWRFETGKSFVNVGIFDSGVEWYHEDFLKINPIVSKVPGGFDFARPNNQVALQTMSQQGAIQPDFSGHGTRVAGIIGALRNNDKGVAGVAGGNWCSTDPNNDPSDDQAGVSLYSYGISQPSGPSSEIIVTTNLISAMAEVFNPDYNKTITDVDILNFSNGLFSYGNDMPALKYLYYYCHLAGKIVVAARGQRINPNQSNAVVYPACFNDDWVISVGGSEETGIKHADSFYGDGMDMIAPYKTTMIHTTTYNGQYSNGVINGTSWSAPHVTGISGLLLSYMNNPSGLQSPENLAPEDVEEIIQRTAWYDAGNYTVPDNTIGWGRADARNVMEYIDKDRTRLLHYSTKNFSGTTQTITKITGNTDIDIIVEDDVNNGTTLAGTYKAAVYKVEYVVPHNITLLPNESIAGFWARSGSSVGYPLYTTSGSFNKVDQHMKVFVDEVNIPATPTSATIWSYFYELKDPNNPNTTVDWMPGNPYNYLPSMDYTIVLQKPYVSSVSQHEKNSNFLQVFPNPSGSSISIKTNVCQGEYCSIKVYNMLGELQKVLYTGSCPTPAINCDISDISVGNYCITFTSERTTINSKLTVIR